MWYLEFLRGTLILVPTVLMAYELMLKKHTIRCGIAALFALSWQFIWHLIVLGFAVNNYGLKLNVHDTLFIGVPIDLVFSCALLMSYVFHKLSFIQGFVHGFIQGLTIHAFILWLLWPFFNASTSELYMVVFYVLLDIIVTVIPSYCLYHWTANDQHIYLRSFLQNIMWAIVLLWLLPTIIFEHLSGTWNVLFQSYNGYRIFLCVLLCLPAYLIINALYHFAKYGNGTGFPYDAPKILVTSGVYGYISNPMQLGIVLMQLIWGMMLNNVFVICTALVATLLFMVFRKICNGTFQLCAQDPDWKAYQANTPRWVPCFKK